MLYKLLSNTSSLLITLMVFLVPEKTSKYKDIHTNQDYEEVKIGNQIWMTKNLNVASFRNGDTIMEVKTRAEWRRANANKQPAWCYYNNDSTNGLIYGKLYNWSAVSDKRGLAPTGWHIPGINEWRILYDFLGEYKGKVGRKLKSTAGWEKSGNGDNLVGFNAVPAGVRTFALVDAQNGYRWMGSLAIWWSTHQPSKSVPDVHCFVIRASTEEAIFQWNEISDGFSVRCIKDWK